MTTTVLEIERKYDVDTATEVPDLAGLPGVDGVSEPVEHVLVAHYVDTADLRLRAGGVTLRHRAGGDDAGWHLKLPLGDAREELQVEGGDPTAPVPAQLYALVRALVRSAPLLPVARLETRRTVRRLLDEAGAVLVEVVDDQVEGTLTGTGQAGDAAAPVRWREWEAELGSADRSLLDVVEQHLLSAGAVRSTTGAKVGRVLAGRPAEPGEPGWWVGSSRRPSSAGSVVQTHLEEQVDELVARDPQVRRDLPDAVHTMRVATRRLRSALRTFRPLLDRSVTDPLRDELRWLAGVLGEARDVEVMHARLRELIAAEPPELVLGPVREKVETVMSKRYRDAHDRVVAELDGAPYLALLDALEALVQDPPFDDAARGRARDVLPPLVRRSWRQLDHTMLAAEAAEGQGQDELLHEARKLAKAARYAGEAVEPAFGRKAARFAKAMRELQDVLGEHQDSVVTRDLLREFGAASTRSGENGFTFGRLHGLEQARADHAVSRWPQVRAEVSVETLRRWLE